MPLIATSIESQRVTRIFLDCRAAPPDPADLLRIERAIEDSAALAGSTEETTVPNDWGCRLLPRRHQRAAGDGQNA
jgi:hypothetical protein